MLEKVYVVYGFVSFYALDLSIHDDRKEEVRIYGIYTSEEVAKQEAKGNNLLYIGVEPNTFLNDCREFWCAKGMYEGECGNSSCIGCQFSKVHLYDSGYALN